MDKSVSRGDLKAAPNGEVAQQLANQGVTVMVGWKNSDGIGHVATVMPANEKYDAENGPKISNVGKENKESYVNDSFGIGHNGRASSVDDIKYYYDPDQTFKYDEDQINQEYGY